MPDDTPHNRQTLTRAEIQALINDAALDSDEIRGVVRDCIRIELRDLLREELRSEMRSSLIGFGVDAKTPLEFQADARFVRQLRKAHESYTARAVATLIGIIVTGTIALVIMGLASWVRGKTGG